MPLSIGDVTDDRYRIVKLLGQGGMGAVYRAWDTRLSRPVALKEMVPQFGLDDESLNDLREQFRQEAQILATLDHPNLVRVTDYFFWEGKEYLVMDFVEGENLADRIARQGAQSESQVLAWAEQLLDALAYCHGRGVLHRDIKPQNIIITPEGRVELVDFGLVKMWNPDDPHTRTVMRGAGTPEYAPPEQYDMGMGHTDPRSDIYSLGATLYHALTGDAPPTATQRMVSPTSFAPLRQIDPRISVNTEAVVLKALKIVMDQRFQSAEEMRQALKEPDHTAIMEPVPARPERVQPAVAERTLPGERKRSGILWGMGGLGLAIVGGVCLIAAVVALLLGTGVIGGGPDPTSQPTTTTEPTTDVVLVPSETPILPTATATSEPTETPLPTVPPISEAWILLEEHFEGDLSGWEVGSWTDGSAAYGDGVYIVRGETPDKAVSGAAGVSFQDVIIDVNATQVSAPAADENGYGVKCRVQSDGDGYGLLTSGDGFYSIWVIVDGDWDPLVEWASSDVVNQGDASNAIRAVCQGDRLALYINGTLVAQAEDTTYTSGDIALVAATFGEDATEIHFDDLVIRQPSALVLQDDFSDPTSGWTVKEWDGGDAGYREGVYYIRAEDKDYYYYGWPGLTLSAVEIEVQAQSVLLPTDDNNSFGVGCHLQSSGEGYFFRISGDGEYSLFMEQDDGDQWFVDWTSSSAIRTGEATNHIRAICSAGRLMLIVNHEILVDVEDDTFTQGDVGLTASTYEDDATEVYFDNVTVYGRETPAP